MTDEENEEYIIKGDELSRLHRHFIPLDLPTVVAAERQEFMREIRSRKHTHQYGDCPDCPILTGDDSKRFNEYLERISNYPRISKD